MKMPSLILGTAALILCNSAGGQTVYKCTNADGSISYQDRACPGSADEKKVSVGSKPEEKISKGYDGKVFDLPGLGEVAILVFDYMETTVRQDGDRATTIGIRSKAGARNKMSMMMTFMPNISGKIPSRQQLESDVKQIAIMQTGNGFTDLEYADFEAQSGTGLFGIVDDPKYRNSAAPSGEYATISVGQIANESFVVAVTILTDGVENQGFQHALDIAESFVVASGIVALNNGDNELDLPAAPNGFSWVQAAEIKGAFLRPVGWHFDKRIEGDDYAYFISREPNVEPDGFDAGFTVNVQTNVPAKTGMSPSQYAQAFIRAGASETEMIGEPFDVKQGRLSFHGALFRTADPVKGDFNAHMVAVANDTTGTVYLCIYEGPTAEWDELWRLGEIMLPKMVVNQSF